MIKINTDKLNSKGFKKILYLVPFVILLSGSFNYLLGVISNYPKSAAVLTVVLHLVFLLSLTAILANVFIEAFLSFFDSNSKSCVCDILYGGRRFIPVRSSLFVIIFIVAYILLCQNANQSALHTLILIVPPIAILFNAPRFLSYRIRYLNGSYVIYSGRFKTVFSYYTNDSGNFCVILNDGKTLNTGINTSDIDFEKLEAEFKKNSLKAGGN